MTSSRFARLRLQLAVLLALPTLALAGPTFFGVEIRDRVPLAFDSAAIQTISGNSREPGYDVSVPFATGLLTGVLATSANGSASASGVDRDGQQFGTASASARAHAQIGQLGGGASLSVSSTNTSPAAGFSFTNRAEVNFDLWSKDDLLLTSATLANGTAVDVQFILTLDSQVTEVGNSDLGVGGVGAELFFDSETGPALNLGIADTDGLGAPALRSVTQTMSLRVGSTYRLAQSLHVFGRGNAGFAGGSLVPTPASWSLDVVADHTSHAFADVLGDATLVSASGHDYALSSPVPTPPSALLALAGLGWLGLARRRSARQPGSGCA
jgi:MYXO-CTERM domain-containing protein